MVALGWAGATLLALSYLLPLRWLLRVQLASCALLVAYASAIGALPYIALNLFVGALIGYRILGGFDG
jgi:hypothetical protein